MSSGLTNTVSIFSGRKRAGSHIKASANKKKFQKEQLAEDGYIEIVDCYADSVENL